MKTVTTIELFESTLKANKYVLIDWSAEWCSPCKALHPVLCELEKVFTNITFIQVDINALPKLAGEYRVQSLPTLMLSKDGRPCKICVGSRNKDVLIKLFKEWMND